MKHFEEEEFACQCGCGKGFAEMDEDFVERLDTARDIADTSFVLTSAYRCEPHNRAVGGKDTSSHVKGLAVDIKTSDSRSRALILGALMDAGFNRIGIDGEFIHVDRDKDKAGDVIWVY